MTARMIWAMELKAVKDREYARLVTFYDEETARNIVNSFRRVTAYYNGKPSQVRTVDGQTVYLVY